jgi:hypothetical protein
VLNEIIEGTVDSFRIYDRIFDEGLVRVAQDGVTEEPKSPKAGQK